MRGLEIRRHTMRTKPGKHLSQAGVALARRIGESLGPFDRVLTSRLPRALETAIAMGFAVDERVAELGETEDDPFVELADSDWEEGFAAFARVIRAGGPLARFAEQQAALWRSIAAALPEDARALIVSHGGIIECGAVASLPDVDHAAWGPALDYCEGVLLAFDGERFTEATLLRLDRPP